MKVVIETEDESFDAESKFNRMAVKFSNSAHIILPREFVGRDVVLFILHKAVHIKAKGKIMKIIRLSKLKKPVLVIKKARRTK